ncbi:MAG: hypothetical protein ACI9XO_004649 [Paraglaciecola sp.]|jgi:hypothetical protein
MTRYFYTLLCSGLAIFVLNSCEQVLEADIGSVENQLVMVSNFSADNQLEVVVTSTKIIADNTDETKVVTNAIVRIYQGTNLLEELILKMPALDSDFPPTYVSLDFVPEVGSVYTLTASAPGYESISASNIIPKGTAVGNIGFNNTLDIKNEELADVNFSIDLNFQDDPTENNYYHILFYQQLLGYRIDVKPNGDFDTISTQTSELAELDLQVLGNDIPFTRFLGEQSLLIKDDSFDGEEVNLTVEGNFSFNIEKHLLGNFSVEIRTVSEAYYLYYTTLSNQSQVDTGATGDSLPQDDVPVFDNVQGGTGIFAGYSSNTTFFIINP